MRILIAIPFLVICLNSQSQGFRKMTAEKSGIEFINRINENDTINGLSYLYLYNGGGVAAGDINNDGLVDIYFTGNQVPDKLFLNLGNLKFKDVTKKYFKDQRFDFHTGVTMVDINNDGWLDIYVCSAGPAYDAEDRRNKLFINYQGKKFVDEANFYGLDDSLNTTQAAFFDADNDGDLDVYLLNHTYLRKNTQYWFQFNQMKKLAGTDRLMINNNGKFTDKSQELGIFSSGYGQGVSISDFNQDGKPDIYVSNDFEYPDRLYMNVGAKGFEERILNKTMHIPLFSMGSDAADINNDGLIDLIAVDMASEDHIKSKKNMSGMSSDNFWKIVNQKGHYQYMYNTLQLNIGDMFIDIGQMAGVAKTDWSWSSIFADFDNDGFQDLFVSNGYLRDLRDNDFTKKYDTIIQISREFIPFAELSKLIPTSKEQNYVFKNNGDLTFEKMSDKWGLEEKINVNGACYADLDNDGDLDLICNASNENSFLLENTNDKQHHYLKVKIKGSDLNRFGIGSKVEVYTNENLQVRELYNSRGYQSGVSNTLHFGLGKSEKIDSIICSIQGKIIGKKYDIQANQEIEFEFSESSPYPAADFQKINPLLELVDFKSLRIKHTEIFYDDFGKELLLPHKMSQLGPFINVDDLNNDGLQDLYVSGARGSKGSLKLQSKTGEFYEKNLELFKTNFLSEEMQSIFFDADNDGDKDVYIVMGSNESEKNDVSYSDQLYLNDGSENFKMASANLPELSISGQTVLAKDVNHDGWTDLVVFGRQVPQNYPAAPDSYILINREGKFIDKTNDFAPEFKELGMVTDAVFVNLDEDEELELIVVGEWMPVTVFDLIDDKFQNITSSIGFDKTVGWWNTIELFEDENGTQKFILGNLGLNNKFHPSEDQPLHIYMTDFDENGTNDIVLAKSQDEILYPIRGRQCSSEQMPFIAEQFKSYDQFAIASVESIYSKEKLQTAVHYEAHTFASSLLTIQNGRYTLEPLPNSYQTGPINSIVVGDFNKDDKKDMFCFGNRFEAEVETVRYDANPSLFYDGSKDFDDPVMLGIIENIKSASYITIQKENYLLIGVNNGPLLIFKIKDF